MASLAELEAQRQAHSTTEAHLVEKAAEEVFEPVTEDEQMLIDLLDGVALLNKAKVMFSYLSDPDLGK